MIRHVITEGVCLLAITPSGGQYINVEVVWVDRYSPAEMELPDIGWVQLPEEMANQKTSIVSLQQRLRLGRSEAEGEFEF